MSITTYVGAAPWKAGPVEPDPVEIALAPTSPDALVAELYRAHYRPLVGLASLVVDRRVEAEEIVQEAFVRLYASWGTLRDPERALGYLRATVLNLARSGIRRRIVARRYLAAHSDEAQVASPAADEVADLSGGDRRRQVTVAVRALPRRQRECVLLRYYGGCSEHEVAAALGISAGSVKTHTSRAMATLATKLADDRDGVS